MIHGGPRRLTTLIASAPWQVKSHEVSVLNNTGWMAVFRDLCYTSALVCGVVILYLVHEFMYHHQVYT